MSAGLAPPAGLRLLAALVTLLLFADGVARHPAPPGLSTFGRPEALVPTLVLLGVGSAWLLARAQDRASLARRSTLLLLGVSLLGQRAVPADPGTHLAFLGLVLLLAAPFLGTGPAPLVAGLALLGAVPAMLGSSFPFGAVSWLTAVLPWMALAWLLPALFPGQLARRPAAVLAGGTALLVGLSLLGYVELATGLDLPWWALSATRLRPLGLHPNLAVPSLVVALALACGLAWSTAGRRRLLALLAALLLLAGLVAVRSRTGHLTALAALGLLVAGRAPWPGRRAVRPLALVALVLLLLMPTTGLTDPTIRRDSVSMVSKAVSFRSAMWELGRDTWAAAPWHGHGPGTTWIQGRHARPSRYDGLPKDDHPHNVVLAVGASLGWPGLAALALLLAAGLRRPLGGPLLADATAAALVGMWAANAVDMGGAARTLYPALAFALLGLREAATARPAGAPDPQGGTRPVQVLALLAGLSLLPLGLAHAAGGWLLRVAVSGLAEDPPPDTERLATLDVGLGVADRLRPLDPAVPEARALVAAAAGHASDQRAQLEEALRRFPGSGLLAHRLGLLAARDDLDDPRARALLEQAVAADPHGPQAWLRLADLAALAAHQQDEPAALEAFVRSVLLNPAAARRAGWRADEGLLVLGPEGGRTLALPLDQVLATIRARREELGRDDPPTMTRLLVREVEFLRELGLSARADTVARAMPGEHASSAWYGPLMRGRVAMAEGDVETALEQLGQAYALRPEPQVAVELLEARSRAPRLDREGFDALLSRALAGLPDLTFESASLRRLLEARLRVAERSGDATEASRLADALDFARR